MAVSGSGSASDLGLGSSSSCELGSEFSTWGMVGYPPSRLSFRSSPSWLFRLSATSTYCGSVVRIGRSDVLWLGDRTDSASEKQAGNSSFRKLVGWP